MKFSHGLAAGLLLASFTVEAQAADLIIDEPVMPVAEHAGSRFDGLYAGFFIGSGGARFTGIVDSGELPLDPPDTETFAGDWSTGLIYGGYAGLGATTGSFYYGAEISITGGGFGAFAEDESGIDSATNDFAYLATVRGRIGVVVDNQTLIFASAGLGLLASTFTAYDNIGFPADYNFDSASIVLPAVVFSAGVEHAITDTLSLRVEGLYAMPSGEVVFETGELTNDMDDGDFASAEGAFQLTAGLTFSF